MVNEEYLEYVERERERSCENPRVGDWRGIIKKKKENKEKLEKGEREPQNERVDRGEEEERIRYAEDAVGKLRSAYGRMRQCVEARGMKERIKLSE